MTEFKTFTMRPYHKSVLWCNVIVHVRRNSDGAISEKLQRCAYDAETKSPSTYAYSEGNFSCDCNRIGYFDDQADIECSTGLYSLRLLHPETREVVYSDGEWQ